MEDDVGKEIVLDQYEVLAMERLLDEEAIHHYLWVRFNEYKDWIYTQKNELMRSFNKKYGNLSRHYYDPYSFTLKRGKFFPYGRNSRDRLEASAKDLIDKTLEDLIERLHGKLYEKHD